MKNKFYKKWWFWVAIAVLIFIVIGGIGSSQTGEFTAYPVQCNDWFMSTAPYTFTPPATEDFSNCLKPEALAREVFNVKNDQVFQTSPDPDVSGLDELKNCTIEDNQNWTCGGDNVSDVWSGGILDAIKISRTGDNFDEWGLTGVIFVTESQWDSINGGKDSVCGNTWCNASN